MKYVVMLGVMEVSNPISLKQAKAMQEEIFELTGCYTVLLKIKTN